MKFNTVLVIFGLLTFVALGADNSTPKEKPGVSLLKNLAKTAVVNPGAQRSRHYHSSRVREVSKSATELPSSPALLAEEAMNLLIPNQKYLIKFEDEENFGKVAPLQSNSSYVEFSQSDVEKYREAVKNIIEYRNFVRQHCSGESSRRFADAMDRYISSLCTFNRKALPLVADITENNSALILIVNRSTLIDAPVLTTRYLQFKKQRFKESMNRFLNNDLQLVADMVTVAKTLKVEISEENWNKSFGVRDNAIESLSQWPREMIFSATEKLNDARESACIFQAKSNVAQQKAEDNKTSTPPAAE
jgi:hypothetical protein